MIPIRDKVEFVYLYKDLFNQIIDIDWFPSQKNAIVKKIGNLAKKNLGYSANTSICDIVWTLQKIYSNLIKIRNNE